MVFESLKDVLNFAITKEQSSYDLYTMFGDMIRNVSAKKLLRDLAAQELGHRRMLENIVSTENVDSILGKRAPRDLQISDYMVAELVNPGSDPHQVMLYAMKREQESLDRYNMLLDNYEGTELAPLFSALASEELRHKETLEREYEEHFAQWM
ncbi:MAG: ferritin family protein [Syntrophales bacterium]